MSNRKIINAASTGGIGYYPVISSVVLDLYYDNVSLLLNGDVEVDSNFANVALLLTGNDLVDKSLSPVALTNTSVTVSNSLKKFGTGSLYFNGSSYFSLSLSTTAAFTFECWFYRTAAVSSGSFNFFIGTSGSGIAFYNNGSTIRVSSQAFTVPDLINQWVHFAATRDSSNNIRVFFNGIESTTGTLNESGTFGWTRIGAYNAMYQFQGYMDDIRLTNGIVRYTANFTPPVKALPTHEILDSSVYRLPVTTYGNTRIDTATKKYGTSSMYFDGNGDYLSFADTSAIAFGTSDFTVELWINFAVATGRQAILSGSVTNSFFLIKGNDSAGDNTLSVGQTLVGTREYCNYTFTAGFWYHVAVSRASGVIYFYVNGIAQTTNSSGIGVTNLPSSAYVIAYSAYAPIPSYFNGYIDDFRITKGVARYTANFTPPSASLPTIPPTIPADPWWGNVSLLLDGNTTDAYDPYWQNVSLMLTGDDFIDWSNQHNAITVVGNTTINTTTKKFSTGSMYFDGGGDYLRIPDSPQLQITGGNFTIELWSYPLTGKQFPCLFSNYNSTSWAANTGVGLYAGHAGIGDTTHYKLAWNGTWPKLTSSATINFNAWTHIALVKNGSTITLYLNGIADSSFTDSSNSYTAPMWWIGTGGYTPDNSDEFNGYIDDFRITKGIARYTANFTPPTAALPSYKIQDRTQNNLTLTPYGNVQLSTDVMKNGTGSMFFNGTTTSRIGGGPSYLISNTDSTFTIEAWVYVVAAPTNGNASYNLYCPALIGLNATPNTGTGNLYFGLLPAMKLALTTYNGNTITSTGTTVLSLNKWYHVACSVSSNVIMFFINGVADTLDSTTLSNPRTGSSSSFEVGTNGYNTFNGYIDDLRVTKGVARYTQNFTPPSQSFATQYISTGYDENYADVSLLLNGNGTNGSQVFTDLSSTPKTITAYGNAQISTAVKKYGTGAIAFDGTGDYLTVPAAAGGFSGDFTIEGGFYYNSLSSGYCPIFDARNSSSYAGILLYLFSTGIYLYRANSGLVTTPLPPTNAWFHFAVTRKNATIYLFINGIQAGTATDSGDFPATTIYLGAFCDLYQYSNAYLDDFRITKGIARYTTNFTPPTYQLPTDTTGTVIDPLRSSTSLLLRGNGTNGSTSFTDESPNGLTVTVGGNSQISTSVKKYGTGSISFDGTGDYLAIAPSSTFTMGTGDFTIEMWAYQLTAKDCTYFEIRDDVGGANAIGIGARTANTIFAWISGSFVLTSSSTISLNTWNHIACTRIGTTVTLYCNGVSFGTVTNSTNISCTNASVAGPIDLRDASSSWKFNGYIDDLRITKGYARYTANFTPPTYEDPIVTGTVYDYNYPQVSLLLNGDGTNGSTVFTDLSSSPKTVTAYDNTQISTSVKKYGTGSIYFDGNGDYLSVAYNAGFGFGSNNFTIECWAYISSFTPSSGPVFASNWGNPPSYGAWAFGAGNNGGVTLSVNLRNSSAADFQISAPASTVTTSQWYHYAVTRTGSTFYIFVNGVQKATGTYSTALDNNSTPILLGRQAYNYDNYGSFNGYIDDFRITNGVARYTQNFTPPTAPLPTSYS